VVWTKGGVVWTKGGVVWIVGFKISQISGFRISQILGFRISQISGFRISQFLGNFLEISWKFLGWKISWRFKSIYINLKICVYNINMDKLRQRCTRCKSNVLLTEFTVSRSGKIRKACNICLERVREYNMKTNRVKSHYSRNLK